MGVSAEYLEYVGEQLSPLGDVLCRKMFGGAGVFLDGKVFGVVADDVLYLKADASNRQDYANLGMEQFRPFPHKDMLMPYFRVPDSVLEDREELCRWAARSLAVPSSKDRRRK